MRRKLCAELPAEALTERTRFRTYLGLLQMSLDGMCDATANLHTDVKLVMMVFRQSVYSPNLCYHEQNNSGRWYTTAAS